MKCFQEKYIGIIYCVKALYYVCKTAGLVPFSFIVNPSYNADGVFRDQNMSLSLCL
jgi:hypothetical protein